MTITMTKSRLILVILKQSIKDRLREQRCFLHNLIVRNNQLYLLSSHSYTNNLLQSPKRLSLKLQACIRKL